MKHERRSIKDAIRVEKRTDGNTVIAGHAAVFYDAADPGTEFSLGPRMVERILPVQRAGHCSQFKFAEWLCGRLREEFLDAAGRATPKKLVEEIEATCRRLEKDVPEEAMRIVLQREGEKP